MADNTYGLLPTYNWRDAVWVVSVLCDILTHPSIEIANMAQLVNVLAPIAAHPKGAYFQTIAYPFLLYLNSMVGERFALHLDPVYFDGEKAGRLEALRCCAVRAGDGTLRVMAINRDFSSAYTISLGNGEATAITLTADSPESFCSKECCCVHQQEHSVSCQEVLLPPGSVTLVFLPFTKS